MNIVVIWDQLGQEPLRFFVTQNPRFLEMDRMYINTYTDDADEKARLDELCALMYDDDGNCKQTMLYGLELDLEAATVPLPEGDIARRAMLAAALGRLRAVVQRVD